MNHLFMQYHSIISHHLLQEGASSGKICFSLGPEEEAAIEAVERAK